VDGDEVRLGEKLLEGHHAHADLRRAGRLDVGIVGDEAHSEGRQALCHEDADPPETDDADGLLGGFDAGVLRALPLPTLQAQVRGDDLAGAGEEEPDR